MRRDEVQELHYIAAIANVPSILEHGILCHRLSSRLCYRSIADPKVQQRRENKPIPGTGKGLHDYVNIYFDAHNPMLSSIRADNNYICVLSIKNTILDLPGVIVSDRNAARDWARFAPAKDGLQLIDKEKVYAQFWLHDNPIEQDEHKGIKCTEVLIPERIDVDFIVGAYVANEQALASFQVICDLPVQLKVGMFF